MDVFDSAQNKKAFKKSASFHEKNRDSHFANNNFSQWTKFDIVWG